MRLNHSKYLAMILNFRIRK